MILSSVSLSLGRAVGQALKDGLHSVSEALLHIVPGDDPHGADQCVSPRDHHASLTAGSMLAPTLIPNGKRRSERINSAAFCWLGAVSESNNSISPPHL